VSTIGTALLPRYTAPSAPPSAPPAPPAPPADPPKNDISIKQAVSGLAGAVAVGAIETVGNTACSLIQTPRALAQAYKTLYKTDMIGPVLKTAIAITLPVGLVAGPALTALGSLGFGIYRGASEAIEHGLASAVSEGVKDIGRFNNDLAGKAVEAMKDAETEHLPAGQKPYDIRVIEAGKGLVGGVAGAVIDGAGIGLITLVRTPQGVGKAYKAIWTSDQGPVLRVTESLLVPPAAIIAAPLATVGGALYGLVTGFGTGYSKGLGESINNSAKTVGKVNDAISEAFKN
jgi:hypothetical protein